ncbi:MAG: LysM peptidoglycan-binding domain-containing protein [Candidatus Omnitrophota bacterium]
MMSKYLYGLLGLCVLLSGCTVRTYPLIRDRVDQDLSTGNRGYLQGIAPAAPERKSKRTTRVVEIELSSPIKIDKRSREEVAESSTTTAASDEEWLEDEDNNQGYITQSLVPVMKKPSQMAFEKYTVQKGDTLQKISQKYFGTTKKWQKIYEANTNTLKGPDKIYVGQVLDIPMDSSKGLPQRIK